MLIILNMIVLQLSKESYITNPVNDICYSQQKLLVLFQGWENKLDYFPVVLSTSAETLQYGISSSVKHYLSPWFVLLDCLCTNSGLFQLAGVRSHTQYGPVLVFLHWNVWAFSDVFPVDFSAECLFLLHSIDYQTKVRQHLAVKVNTVGYSKVFVIFCFPSHQLLVLGKPYSQR